MRRILTVAVVLVLAGCAPKRFTLGPGDSVILATPDRAKAFRADTGCDVAHTGKVVSVTRPLTVRPDSNP